jgi:peptidoglycan hydrolase CwlO-like protein
VLSHTESQPAIPSPLVASSKKRAGETGPTPTDLLNITRADLTEAQRSRSELQDRLSNVTLEVETLRKKSTQEARRINSLESERAQLHMRLKDRDAELKGKAKLLEVCIIFDTSRLSSHKWISKEK